MRTHAGTGAIGRGVRVGVCGLNFKLYLDTGLDQKAPSNHNKTRMSYPRDTAWSTLVHAIAEGEQYLKVSDVNDDCSDDTARSVLQAAESANILDRESEQAHKYYVIVRQPPRRGDAL